MTAPMTFAHSPFLYHHVPNSPFLQPPTLQTAQSPAPFVPDIDDQRDGRYSSSGQHYNGKTNKRNKKRRNIHTGPPYPINPNLLSPTSAVPSISAPPTPQTQQAPCIANVSSTLQKEQVVPHFSPLVKKERHSLNRKERSLEASPSQTTVPEINLFSGDEIFA